MKAFNRSLPWIALLLLAFLLALAGCTEKKPPEQASAPEVHETDDGHDQEQEHAQTSLPGEEPMAPSVEEMGDITDEDGLNNAKDKIITLGQWVAGDDDDLAADAAESLIDVVKTNSNNILRAEAIKGLGQRSGRFEDLIIEATREKDRIVRDAAIVSLSSGARGSRAEVRLSELAASGQDGVADLAQQALKRLREGGTGDDVTLAVSQLGQYEGDLSAQAAIKLKLMGAKALPALDRAIRTTDDARKRHAATMCVALICAGTSPTQEAFAKTVKAIKKTSEKAHEANLDGLEILAFAITAPDAMTREVAAQGLGYLGDERAAKLLAKALKDTDVHVRRRAASALITTPAKSVEAAIIDTALKDQDEKVRRFAVETLGWIGGENASQALVRASQDPSAEVRRYAATQLGRIKDPATLEALVQLYKDARVRETELEDPRDRTKEQDVRWAAVQAVAELRDRDSTDVLVEALDDPVPQVSNAAELGLQKIGVAKRKMPGIE